MNRDDFRRLAETRLEDAKALLQAGRFDVAYYLAGYAVECALKACICRNTRESDFPPKDGNKYYIHDLNKLLGLAELVDAVEQRFKVDQRLEGYWNVVKDWNVDSRYGSGSDAETKARDLFEAITDAERGVFQCLSNYW